MGVDVKNPIRLKLPIGVDLDTREFAVGPDHSPSMNNVTLHKNSIRVRLGENAYINKAHNNISAGIQAMHRYRSAAGTKGVVVSSGLFIYRDDDNGNFNIVSAAVPNGDDSLDFCQFKDSLGMFSELGTTVWYNADATTPSITPTMAPINFSSSASFNGYPATSGGFLLDKFYIWRITFDIKHGDTFMGETQAAGTITTPFGVGAAQLFQDRREDWTGGSGNDNLLEIRKASASEFNYLPDYVSAINLYRSPPLNAIPTGYLNEAGGQSYMEYTDLFYVSSISRAALVALAPGAAIFIDNGSITLGKQIGFGYRWYPPRFRHAEIHKGHLWGTNAMLSENVASPTYTTRDLDSVYYSGQLSALTGTGPLNFKLAAPVVELDPYSGEGATGLASWRNKVLLAFKKDSTHAIVGGDENLSPSILNVGKEVLSSTVGCVAPRTIVKAEGAVMWVSHRGPEIFDGTGPRPLNAEKVKPLFDLIPASRRRKMVAYYDSKDREYVIFWTSITNLVANRNAMRYSFITGEWTLDTYERGVGSVLEINDTDSVRRLLFGYDDLVTYFNTFTNDPIIVYGKTAYENGVIPQTPIEWSFAYPFTDLGDPTRDDQILMVKAEGQWVDPVRVSLVVTGPDGDQSHTKVVTTEEKLFEAPVGGKGLAWVQFPPNLGASGKHVQVRLTGETSTGQTDLTDVYLHVGPIGR